MVIFVLCCLYFFARFDLFPHVPCESSLMATDFAEYAGRIMTYIEMEWEVDWALDSSDWSSIICSLPGERIGSQERNALRLTPEMWNFFKESFLSMECLPNVAGKFAEKFLQES